MYTLKKHKQKLKMRGLGPHVINDITSGGAVCLETLEGEPMANFINGSCLKRFHEPLTEEMLEKMHAARTRKEALETMKKEAQEEARQRAAKAKARRHQISAVETSKNEDADYVPPLLLEIGITNTNHNCKALLDSGAAVNIMAENVFKEFVKQPLTSTSTQLNSIANQTINCRGMVTITIQVAGYKEDCLFYVTENDASAHDMVLGRTWLHRHKCQIEWGARLINLVLGTQNINLPAASENISNTVRPSQQCSNMEQLLLPMQQSMNTTNATDMRQKWVPKQMLQAKKGREYIWVPKINVVPVKKSQFKWNSY